MLTVDAINDLYTLSAILAHPRTGDIIRSSAKLERDRIAQHVARAFRDYIFMICWGEARHASPMAKKVYYKETGSGGGRSSSYKRCLKYSPVANLPLLECLFDDQSWDGSYGGKAWGNIARFGQRYGQLPDMVFVDHVVDLHHNGGTLFNKIEVSSCIGFTPSYRGNLEGFLNWRAQTSSYLGEMHYRVTWDRGLSLPVGRLLIQFSDTAPDVIDRDYLKGITPREVRVEYSPVEWGDLVLGDLAEKEQDNEGGDSSDTTRPKDYGLWVRRYARLMEDIASRSDVSPLTREA